MGTCGGGLEEGELVFESYRPSMKLCVRYHLSLCLIFPI